MFTVNLKTKFLKYYFKHYYLDLMKILFQIELAIKVLMFVEGSP